MASVLFCLVLTFYFCEIDLISVALLIPIHSGYIGCMGIMYLLTLSCMQEEASFDSSVDEIQQAENFSLDLNDLQESLDWFFMEVSAMRLSELLKFEADMLIVDPMCPQPFPGVFQTTAWNNGCTTFDEVFFEGRSQALYFEDRDWEGEYYEQVATFISSYTIGASPGDWYLMVNGYGDIRNNENADWMEVVGTFDQQGTDLSWPSTFQSTALRFERENDQLHLAGGISQTDTYKWPIVGVLLDECTLSATDIECEVLIQTVSGDRIELSLTGEHEDCADTEFGSLCWDVSDVWSMSW